MIRNEGKTGIVFGVRNDSSISWAIAKKLSESGCTLALTYLPDTEIYVKSLMKEHQMDPELAFQVDVRDEGEIEIFMKTLSGKFGKIDYILHGVAYANQKVLCAPIPGSPMDPPEYIDIPFEDLMDSFNISAYSLIRICRVAEKYLSDKASILTLTYNASQRVFPGYAGMSINKAALENMVIYLADYFGPKAIRVNAISAGLVMTSSAMGIKGVRQLRKIGKHSSPLGNISAEDIANTALYYFSNLSEKATGNIHFLDGGFNIMGVSGHEN